MSLGRYLIGVAALLCVLGSLGVGAAALRRYLLPDWRGAHARLAEIVTGCALLVGSWRFSGPWGCSGWYRWSWVRSPSDRR
jgi:hypothetical protein